MAVVGDMVNAGEVVGVGISADVTDMIARNDRARVLQVPILCGDRGIVRVGSFAGACAHVGDRFADTAGPTLKVSGRTHPF
jgi:hypothetical protein